MCSISLHSSSIVSGVFIVSCKCSTFPEVVFQIVNIVIAKIKEINFEMYLFIIAKLLLSKSH